MSPRNIIIHSILHIVNRIPGTIVDKTSNESLAASKQAIISHVRTFQRWLRRLGTYVRVLYYYKALALRPVKGTTDWEILELRDHLGPRSQSQVSGLCTDNRAGAVCSHETFPRRKARDTGSLLLCVVHFLLRHLSSQILGRLARVTAPSLD